MICDVAADIPSFDELLDLLRERLAVERCFGRLKHEAGLAPLRVRGLDKVALHADLCILATLISALAPARAVPLAA